MPATRSWLSQDHSSASGPNFHPYNIHSNLCQTSPIADSHIQAFSDAASQIKAPHLSTLSQIRAPHMSAALPTPALSSNVSSHGLTFVSTRDTQSSLPLSGVLVQRQAAPTPAMTQIPTLFTGAVPLLKSLISPFTTNTSLPLL